MKKAIFSASVLALATLVASCSKETNEPSIMPKEDYAELKLDFPGVTVPTKVPLVADEISAEASVYDIQVLVFNENGLELAQKINGTTGSLKVTKGSKTVVAVANYSDDLSKCESPEDVYETATSLDDNTIGSTPYFVMSGETEVEVEGSTQASITLERIAAKFLIRDINLELNSAFSALDISIDRIYLDNAVVNATLGGEKAPLSTLDFVNERGGFDDNANYQPWTSGYYDDWTMDEDVYSTKLYAYPNITEDEDDDRDKTGAFTVRKTRIVVEATLKGKKTFYPFTFSGPIERNHYYEITDLVITGYGVEHPEDPTPTKGDFTVNVIVKPWEQGGSTSIEI